MGCLLRSTSTTDSPLQILAIRTKRDSLSVRQDRIAQQIDAVIELLSAQIAEFDGAIARLPEKNRTLASPARPLSIVPGIGPTVLPPFSQRFATRHARPTPRRVAAPPVCWLGGSL